MPFQRGHKINKGSHRGGRRGFEYEEEQLKEMRAILNRALITTKRIQLGEAGYKEQMAYENSIKMALKCMDKLHANKEKVEHSGDIPFQIIEISQMKESSDDK